MRHTPLTTNRPVSSVTIDGVVCKVGDAVCFKSDIEQCGTIVAIERTSYGHTLHLENEYGFHGDYIGGDTETTVSASDCWID